MLQILLILNFFYFFFVKNAMIVDVVHGGDVSFCGYCCYCKYREYCKH